jgi:UDP-N-acetylglucosamine acyltransferase
MPPQDFKFTLGMPTAGVRIGTGSVLREGVTVHASTKPDVPTSIGDRVLMMANSHAGHDVKVGNDVVLANGALLAGHSQVGDRANISGNVAIHQFNRVGRLAFVSGGSVMSMDIPPFCIGWARNRIAGVNLVGMRRSGMPREHITAVRQAFTRILRNPMPKSEMVAKLRELGHDCPPVLELADFVETAKRVAPGFGRLTHDELALWRAFQRGHLIASVEEESME